MRAGSLCTLIGMLAAAASASAQTLTYRGFVELADERLDGLSGITFGGDRTYYAVTDQRPQAVTLGIMEKPDGGTDHVNVRDVKLLAGVRDAEGVAAGRSRLFVSDESPANLTVRPLDRVGDKLRRLPMPEAFSQVVRNQSLESLTISADGETLWTANERALVVDGNPQTPATPIMSVTRCRLLRYVLAADGTATPREQFEYDTSGVHDWGGQIGLCDLAALPDGRLLALERSAAQNFSGVASIRTRIFLVDTVGATDVGKPPYDNGFADQPDPPAKVKKTLLYDGFVRDADGENVEGLCLGPKLGENCWAVIGVVDNTDGGLNVSTSGVVSWELDLTAAPFSRPSPASSPSPGTPGEGRVRVRRE